MAVNSVTTDVSERRGRNAESWRAESVCRNRPTRWWFGGDQRETVRAKRICAGCAVQAPCLEFALLRPQLVGVWAATTPAERAALRRTGDSTVETSVEAAVVAPAHLEEHEEDEGKEHAATAHATTEHETHEKDVDIDLVLEGERDADAARRRGRRRTTFLADGDELLTPAEAARRLGVTANTVTRWARAGKIAAFYTMGGHRRFRGSEVERVLLAANQAADDRSSFTSL